MNPYTWEAVGMGRTTSYAIYRLGVFVAGVRLRQDLPFHSVILTDWCNSLWLVELGVPTAGEQVANA